MFVTTNNITVKFFLSGFCLLSLFGIILGMASFMMVSPQDKAKQHMAVAKQYQLQASLLPISQGQKILDASYENVMSSIFYAPYDENKWDMLNDIQQQKQYIARVKMDKKIITQDMVLLTD